MPFRLISVSLLAVLVFLGTGEIFELVADYASGFSHCRVPLRVENRTKQKNDSHLGRLALSWKPT
jgi:hypothetical protein